MKTKQWITRLLTNKACYLSAVLIALCVAGGFLTYGDAKPAPDEAPTLVRTAIVGKTAAEQQRVYTGEVRGRYETQLAFQVGGRIIDRRIEVGSVVRAGDALVQIDPRDLRQTVNSGAAQATSAASQLQLAENNLNRYKQLAAIGAVSRAVYEQYVHEYQAAQAGAQQAAAQYEQGANQLDYSVLRADGEGVVTHVAVEAGQVVSAGQNVATIVKGGEREVEIGVPENRVRELRQASLVQVTFWAIPNKTINGVIREISPVADPVTRTYKVRVSLSNPPQEVQLGMTAAVHVPEGGASPIISIPLSALYQENEVPAVWLVQDGVLVLRPVTIGAFGSASGGVQVVGGLNPGDCIVTAGVHKLKEGQKVKTGAETI